MKKSSFVVIGEASFRVLDKLSNSYEFLLLSKHLLPIWFQKSILTHFSFSKRIIFIRVETRKMHRTSLLLRRKKQQKNCYLTTSAVIQPIGFSEWAAHGAYMTNIFCCNIFSLSVCNAGMSPLLATFLKKKKNYLKMT